MRRRHGLRPFGPAAAAVLGLVAVSSCGGGSVMVDDFEKDRGWEAHPADGVALDISREGRADGRGRALRLDFSFTGGGYAIARLETDLDLPANYEFRFRLRGDAPANHLEFKLVDDTGENVWWKVRRDVAWPHGWETVRTRKRQIEFAWGPRGGGEISHVAAIEFAVTAGGGGSGTIWIDDLELVPLPVRTGPPPAPAARASSEAAGHPAAAALDGDPASWWAPRADDPAPGLELDFDGSREYGGLTVVWVEDRHAVDYLVETSDDGESWAARLTVAGGNGGRDDLYLPETESSRLRLRPLKTAGSAAPAVAEIMLRPLAWSATREAFFMNIAAEARRGLYPRGFLGEPTAWTVVGRDHDSREGLLGADGALEVGPGGFSLEPFLWADGRLLTWADVTATPSLVDGDLPLPRVTWRAGPWRLRISPVATGEPERSSLLVRYEVENRGSEADSVTLYLALRPFQVNPPVQFLNVRGGTARVGAIARDENVLVVDGRPRVGLSSEPDGFGAVAFAAGDVVADYLAGGRWPTAQAVDDPFGAASAVVAYRLRPASGASDGVTVAVPLHEASPMPTATDWNDAMARARASWSRAGDDVVIEGPPAARDAIATMKAQLGWILVNRAGPAFQPGTRSYARSWIRDGALTGVALLRMGHAAEVREFLEWYAPHQYPNGKIPCVVDARGADPVPEHDSTGEFIYLVAELYRYTGDRALLEAMWPRVLAGAGYLESLLAERTTEEYRAPDKREFYGILPPSISHEGYAAKPMHSYWDDFFALRGLKDAARLAVELGDGQAGRLAALRDTFAGNLGASVAASMARHDIDYVPGCADLGDFDATSTTVALDPAGARDILPDGALERTFDRYWSFFAGRAAGDPWEAFTPYEVRTIGAFVRLGWRDRAQDLLGFFLRHRTPPGWRQWAEVVARDTTTARFIGDMPHTWVGSDFVRSMLDVFVYEQREGGDGPPLVLAAGVPGEWLEEGGVRVARIPTPYGSLGYRLFREGDDVVMRIEEGPVPPTVQLLLDPPAEGSAATVGGNPAPLDEAGRVVVTRVPAEVRWRR